MGIIYVGLAYRCKEEGTFQDAPEDLHTSIACFEARAKQFHADTNRVGLTGGSAGTPFSTLLAEEIPACKTYIGLFGVYDFLNNTNSLFPEAAAYKNYGLDTPKANARLPHITTCGNFRWPRCCLPARMTSSSIRSSPCDLARS